MNECSSAPNSIPSYTDEISGKFSLINLRHPNISVEKYLHLTRETRLALVFDRMDFLTYKIDCNNNILILIKFDIE